MIKVRLFFLTILGTSCLLALGQTEGSDVKTKPWNPPVSQDRFILDFNNDMWLEYPDSIDPRAYSLGIGSYIMYDYLIGKSPFSFAWGYGFSSHNVHSNGELRIDTLEGKKFARLVPFPENSDYRKNKISATFIEIPIELRFRTSGSSPFKLYAGGRIGYLVNFHTKTSDDSGKRKFYHKDIANKLRYGLTARIGIGQINVHCFYGLSTLFIEDGGDRIIPWSLGLSMFLL